MIIKKTLSSDAAQQVIQILKSRFEKNMHRHVGIVWTSVEAKLLSNIEKIQTLDQMETTGGEPDVIALDPMKDEYVFYDCSLESPVGRRSVCYDSAGLESRKDFKPENNAVDMAAAMGIELLNETQYRELQQFGSFDTKTSSWLKTPTEIRKHGGAIFGDFRYGHVFVYHNGAQSYYAARGFRGFLRV